MKVLFLSSEVHPFSKTGGLADVAGALPAALAALGHDVKVVTPRYLEVRDPRLQPTGHVLQLRFPFGPLGGPLLSVKLSARHEVLFLDCPALYGRPGLYGDGHSEFADNARRFAYLCAGALQAAQRVGFAPDIVHLNDWQTGLAAVALRTGFRQGALARACTVFTVHNLAYQGHFPKGVMDELGLPWSLFRAEGGLEFYDGINLLKAGLVFSDALTTVSPTYAKEIQTPEQGYGLDGLLRERAEDLHGIVNGIDVGEWDPRTDPHLPQRFGPGDLAGKAACKRALLERFELPAQGAAGEAPLFATITRLAHQKGVDLLLAALPDLLARGARFVALGNGDPRYEAALRELAHAWPRQVGVHIGFDVALSHLIEAGADFFLMPSRYEPCGLNQMYSQAYATLPVVRATGGLADTVDAGPEGTGIAFGPFEPEALQGALDQALALYADAPRLARFRERALARDFSWAASARQYEALYRTLLAAPSGAR
ncbi:glycogen synthase GlgA [Aggregicoccus sp. 17bor-14]|uniref:glycogen synthase GlgA n=1 Tax=Myxococcaceae TaxID=31 RepID=UPI00129CB2F9|nr:MULTISPECIES: glycogen synthase GlgA [Myxococcaceae]MBF5043595.1 glycogen synthase GlgA [Simulacricoccus sp. 17bor-14]MRI89354.1 glycogen synthase GlgA [Aggregicoccus sp. 17bor-14]